MDYPFMEVLDRVKEDLIKDGMPEAKAQSLINKFIWILACRL
jgi:hypothetical protein